MKKISRNGPCPCGSGRKYKSCCEKLTAEQRQVAQLRQKNRDAMLGLESLLARKLLLWYAETLEISPLDDPLFDADQLAECEDLLVLWAAFDAGDPEGPTLLEAHLDAFLETESGGRGGLAGRFLAAQCVAVPGIWELLRVYPNAGARVRERLSGVEYEVMDPQLGRTHRQHDHIVGKVVELEHYNLIVGAYPRAFPHEGGTQLVQWMREAVRERVPEVDGTMAPEVLRRPWVRALLYRRAADLSQVLRR